MPLIAILAIASMILITFLIYRAFGPKEGKLLYSGEEKEEWDQFLHSGLGPWFTRSSIFATLTSLATVYVFFVGNTRLMGFWIFATLITIVVGGHITVSFTKRILKIPKFSALIHAQDQSSAVICSIFLDGTDDGLRTAKYTRIFFILYLLGIIWVEFSVFSRITQAILAPDSSVFGSAVIFFTVGTISYFTIQYGLRGFVFADLFQSPIIVFGSLILFIGASYFMVDVHDMGITDIRRELLTPLFSVTDGVVFVLAALFLNAFLVVSTPAHWARIWIFGGNSVLSNQIKSTYITAAIWFILILVGLVASFYVTSVSELTSFISGEMVVVDFLAAIGEHSFFLLFVFWMVAVSALFSTADSQLFALILVRNYDPVENKLKNTLDIKSPFFSSAIFALILAVAFYVKDILAIDLAKVVLSILPLCLTLVPPLVLSIYNQKGKSPAFLVSLIGYIGIAGAGFFTGSSHFTLTLAAPLFPLVIAFLIYVKEYFYSN